MRKSIILAILAATAISACSPRPYDIEPINMGGVYNNLNCAQTEVELHRERTTLANLYADQHRAASSDASWFFALIPVPVARISGENKGPLVAESKGRVVELEHRLSRCAPATDGSPSGYYQ